VQAKYEKEVKQIVEKAATPQMARQLSSYTGTVEERAQKHLNATVWKSIFMPRYSGFVWIALCIALSALLMRLPTRGFRIASIAAEVRNTPEAKRLIVWEKFFNDRSPSIERDPLESLTKAGWKRVDLHDYRVRFHWNWEELYVYRRTEYRRE